MMYLQEKPYLPLILFVDWNGTAIYLEGSHIVQQALKGHADKYVIQGKGVSRSVSTKIQLKTTSLTKKN